MENRAESKWHEGIRKELKKSRGNAFDSHSGISRLELYRGENKRENCLSDVDLVVLDSDNKKIVELIEIETAINPKKLIGIVLATHFCDSCRMPEGRILPLREIPLTIIYKKEKAKSKKPLKIGVIEKALDEAIKRIPGSVKSFQFLERE